MTPTARATWIGGLAVPIWSTLPLMTTYVASLPSFEICTVTFSVASVVVLLKWVFRGGAMAVIRQPFRIWLLGIYGLFGYHFIYFMAYQKAPAIEVNLISTLWPLLIVLFSGLLPEERLHWFHVVGALISLAGVSLVVTKGESLTLRTEYIPGYLCALTAALIWSSFSVLSRRVKSAHPNSIELYCLLTAILSAASHYFLETTVAPTPFQWVILVLMGAGPLGLAFFVWDYGVKHGNIKTLGILSYLGFILGIGLLIAFGRAEFTPVVAAAVPLVLAGSLLASGRFSR